MSSSFYKNYTNQKPSYSPRSIPVQKPDQKSTRKVISVPVQFISSDQQQPKPSLSNNSAAVTIQKMFRSFLVRKCMKKINSIKTEVNEIERRINETVDLIRNNPKERLRINETLMSLLFKLDSIRGIDSGVRELRKTVTKKAIALQEKVDSIAQSNDSDNVTETVKEVVENCDYEEAVKDVVENEEAVKPADDESVEQVTRNVENEKVVEEVVNSVKFDEGSKILEKLMEGNDKMMKLMRQISERNELQTRMINSLSRRVEQLEKGYKIQKKKKRKTNGGLRRRDKDDFYF